MKKTLSVLILLFLLFSFSMPALAEEASISAKAAIVYEPETGTVLYEKNIDDKMLIASTTKIMTALIALENCSLDDVVTITKESVGVEGSSLYLTAGDTYTMQELLYGLMLESGNDAASAIAIHVAGDIISFADLMNERANQIGCSNTHFTNPHGLDDETHYSSARDLALITAEALKNEDFVKIVSTKSISINSKSYTNHNKLLWMCEGVIGVKTGYTKSAGRILVSCAERNGMRLICVTLSDPNDWNDHILLYEDMFSNYKVFSTPAVDVPVGTVDVISGTSNTVSVFPANCTNLLVSPESEVDVTVLLPKFVYANITKGEIAGQLVVTKNGEQIFTTDLVYSDSVDTDTTQLLTFTDRLYREIKRLIP